jgi:hypothetical protein
MRRFFKDKFKGKKTPKTPQPEAPTQIVDGPPGFPAELSNTPKGGVESFPSGSGRRLT